MLWWDNLIMVGLFITFVPWKPVWKPLKVWETYQQHLFDGGSSIATCYDAKPSRWGSFEAVKDLALSSYVAHYMTHVLMGSSGWPLTMQNRRSGGEVIINLMWKVSGALSKIGIWSSRCKLSRTAPVQSRSRMAYSQFMCMAKGWFLHCLAPRNLLPLSGSAPKIADVTTGGQPARVRGQEHPT